MSQVTHFGLHYADGVAFLLQGDGAENLFDKELKCPYTVNARAKHCPHSIELATRAKDLDQDRWLWDHPLALSLLPNPHWPQVSLFVFKEEFDPAVVRQLQDLGSPCTANSLVLGSSAKQPSKVHDQFRLTNLTPMVLLVDGLQDMPSVNDLIRTARISPRRLVICSRERLPNLADVCEFKLEATELFTKLKPETPLRQIGAAVLHSIMRGSNDHPALN